MWSYYRKKEVPFELTKYLSVKVDYLLSAYFFKKENLIMGSLKEHIELGIYGKKLGFFMF